MNQKFQQNELSTLPQKQNEGSNLKAKNEQHTLCK